MVHYPLCVFSNEEQTIYHLFLSCRRFTILSKIISKFPFVIDQDLTIPVILSFGASTIGYSHKDLCAAVREIIIGHCFLYHYYFKHISIQAIRLSISCICHTDILSFRKFSSGN